MNALAVIGGLFVISFLMALAALRKEKKRPREIEHTRHSLKKEKIIFKR